MAVIPSQDALTVRRLRLGIGVLGIALPFVLVAGDALLTGRFTVLDSISAYHRTGMRDVFVGSLCAIGVFLVCYRYARLDDLLSTVAGALAIAVALLPVAPADADPTERLVGRAHQVCAAALFVLLALFCFLFARSSPSRPRLPAEKRGHHGIYRTCGVVILAAVGLALASNALPGSTQDALRPLFWCETVAVLAFGAAWLTKGVAIVKDAARIPGPPVDEPGTTRADQPA
ncbi:DUF998 domain-containing protein [Micromonospora siamensis]|uniref:DUF998 domain-containing protein n=1 Tax=Micromonospora siamensis TaxID=299152 RepID=A0A1C5IQQ0_9ACTN|nr:DUF998 domain-containing protein [Micromonospora siamensis]SCG60660.1 hypothetical protein GA0074704_3707 [Micromonospora siamensis]